MKCVTETQTPSKPIKTIQQNHNVQNLKEEGNLRFSLSITLMKILVSKGGVVFMFL